jgi:hypothetical protein
MNLKLKMLPAALSMALCASIFTAPTVLASSVDMNIEIVGASELVNKTLSPPCHDPRDFDCHIKL